jgi:site-specific recombinase XerD
MSISTNSVTPPGLPWVNKGLDTRLIQDFLGHKAISSTAIYTELDPHRLAAVRVR